MGGLPKASTIEGGEVGINEAIESDDDHWWMFNDTALWCSRREEYASRSLIDEGVTTCPVCGEDLGVDLSWEARDG